MQAFVEPTTEPYSVAISEDNQGTIKLAKNPISSKPTKHIDIKQKFIRDMVEATKVNPVYVNTSDQHACVPTKRASSPSHWTKISLRGTLGPRWAFV